MDLVALLERQLERIPDTDQARRIRILATLAVELYFDEAAHRGWDYANQALDAARRFGQPAELGIAVSAYLLSATVSDHVPEIRAVIGEMLGADQPELTPRLEMILRANLLTERIRLGELAQFDSEFPQVWRLATDVLHSPELQGQLHFVQGSRYLVAGDADRGVRIVEAGFRSLANPWREPQLIVLESCLALISGTLAGESGSGKTMTALSLFGLLPHGARVTGSIRLDGTELLGLTGKQLRAVRGRQIAMVSQDPSTALHPILPIGTQLTEHMRHHLDVSKSEALARAAGLLETVRIPDPEQALRSYAGQFSGGMRQRIAIAVALAAEPRLLVADEPTTALDVTVQAGILRLLDRLCRERGMAVIVITHDLGVMSATARRLSVMYACRLAEAGPTSQLLASPRHPYTRGLLDALPHPEAGARRWYPSAAARRRSAACPPAARSIRAASTRSRPARRTARTRSRSAKATCWPARPTHCEPPREGGWRAGGEQEARERAGPAAVRRRGRVRPPWPAGPRRRRSRPGGRARRDRRAGG